jgi:hypothetical protein
MQLPKRMIARVMIAEGDKRSCLTKCFEHPTFLYLFNQTNTNPEHAFAVILQMH